MYNNTYKEDKTKVEKVSVHEIEDKKIKIRAIFFMP